MADYPSNSNKSKEAMQQRAPIAKNTPNVYKTNENHHLLRMIFAQDFKDIKEGLIKQWIEPQLKNLAWGYVQFFIDTIKNGVKMMIYENYKPTNNQQNSLTSQYSYSNYYSKTPQSQNAPSISSPSKTTLNYDEFEFETEEEAKGILQEMKNIIATSKAVSVLDYYNLSRVSTANYPLQDWGWTNLDFAEVQSAPSKMDGRLIWIITLPRAKSIK